MKNEKKICNFDLDGTLADCEHRKHFIQQEKPDWDAFFLACDEDKPIEHMQIIHERMWLSGDFTTIIFSGRSAKLDEALLWSMKSKLDLEKRGVEGTNNA